METVPFDLLDNRPRNLSGPGVESWFFRVNDPTRARAIWLKATTLSQNDGTRVAEAWCSLFDDENTWGAKETFAREDASFRGSPLQIDLGKNSFSLNRKAGHLRGELVGEDGTAVEWDLTFHVAELSASLTQPLCLLPSRRLIDARLPKNKLLTPAPILVFNGMIRRNGEDIVMTNWLGSQGHNWGQAHAKEYAWGQCIFTDGEQKPFAYVEAASAKIEIAGRTTPFLSMMTVRYGDVEYRFDRLLDLWNQTPEIAFPRWSLKMKGPQGTALLVMEAKAERMVCLGYENPDKNLSYCLNSKTASVSLRVNPVNREAFECVSEYAGALEFLQPVQEPTVQPVV